MQQRQEALHPINARSLRAETYRDILVASPPSAELREACPVEPECRAARGGHAAGEIVRHVTDAATIRISAAAGRDRRGSRGSGGPGADRERDLTVERLEQRHEPINRFVVTRLVEKPIELRGRGTKAPDDLTARERTFRQPLLRVECQRVQQAVTEMIGILVVITASEPSSRSTQIFRIGSLGEGRGLSLANG